MNNQDYNYDLLVIGGGSGGLSCALQSVRLGFKVGIADFSKPSPLGKTWRLGGTCVNVGCIPKKLFHQAALLGQQRNDAQAAGWDLDTTCNHNWNTMTSMVQSFIENLNSGYETSLKKQNIDHFNAYASFKDPHTLQLKFGDDKVQIVTAKYIVISVGLRPFYPEGLIKSQARILSSDDIFSAQTPKSTLIVGASYIALETASFLQALGYHVTVMVRSIFLRGFDQQMANKVGEILENKGVTFLKGFIPVDAKEIEVNGEKMIEVQYQRTDGTNEIQTKCFHTVIAATGRVPKIDDMNLKEIGIKINEQNGKIMVSPSDETNIPGLFAIGDIANGRPELSPPAKLAGKLLAERLFNKKIELTDYTNIPTAVFAEVEYSFVGLSEEDAIKKFGEENIEVFHTHFKPLEWNYYFDHEDNCYTKIIVNKLNKNRLVGIHYLGPTAGEIIQGYVVAFKMGVTLKDLKNTVGIHPTCAEEIVGLEKTKREDPDARKTGCWGWAVGTFASCKSG